MTLSVNGYVLDTLIPLYSGRTIDIGIDSSKTNTAIAIGLADGSEEYIEMYGANDGTSKEDTLALCKKHRQALSILLKDAKPRLVGIEDIITTDTHGKRMGISIHMSRFKITAVFMSLISFFQDTFGITPELVNNQTWKAAILPEEFCKRTYDKGSLAYFKSIHSEYADCTDDVTDAICILRFLRRTHPEKLIHPIDRIEATQKQVEYLFTPTRVRLSYATRFSYNKEYALKDNVAFMGNRISRGMIAVAPVRCEDLPLGELIGKCSSSFKEREEEVLLVVSV